MGGVIHRTHRAALLYKNPEHYNQFNWEETPVIDYFWPQSQFDYYKSFANSEMPF
jgi:hypothetical protein